MTQPGHLYWRAKAAATGRMASGVVITLVLGAGLLAGCKSDNSNFGELSDAARRLAVQIADDGDEITVLANESACVVSSTCPDVARVELSSSSVNSSEEVAEIARAQGWSVEIIDTRLVLVKDGERGMEGSISRDASGRVTIAVGED